MSVLHECPQCGAMVRPEDGWCSLCFHRFDRFDPLTAPLDEVLEAAGEPPLPSAQVSPRPAASGAQPEELPSSQATPSRRSDDPPDGDLGVDAMLALLAVEHQRDSSIEQLGARMSDKSTRLMVMVGGSLMLAILIFAGLGLMSLFA